MQVSYEQQASLIQILCVNKPNVFFLIDLADLRTFFVNSSGPILSVPGSHSTNRSFMVTWLWISSE